MAQDRTRDPEYHRPVLVEEVVGLLAPVLPGVVVDATFGGGGHTRRLLEEHGEDVTVIAIDRDPEAVENARHMGVEAKLGNFGDIADLVELPEVDGVLFDFGVSSHQLDTAERGFSYGREGPLDMRMGPDAAVTAHEIVNGWEEGRIASLLLEYGEEPLGRRIAKAIVAARPIQTTTELSTVVAQTMPAARRRVGHPARRTFQALRIAANDELTSISSGLDGALEKLGPSGRLLAISYHSLEDRIVKRRFAAGAAGCTCPPGLPICGCGNTAELRILTRKPIRPSAQEVAVNKRARSARLRAAERIAS
ncbi:MAG: 16S rRNA (cytosine(1402)-N(4))-methyltransferase RsmH [Acidimicrobiia bacterium]|nr:16S rRNA (cytosine(1402)-N(4))-methyltransferase RsmH [Acidimicrobiia bacterium]